MARSIFVVKRSVLLLAGLFALQIGVSTAARAQSCNEDLQAMSQSRMKQIQALHDISKAHGGKLDPEAACPHLRAMEKIEAKMLAYLKTNGTWCNIPEQFVDKFKANTSRTATMTAQACALAAKEKQIQESGGFGMGKLPPPPKLPTGPLPGP